MLGKEQNSDTWEEYSPLFPWSKTVLIDGTTVRGGYLMRRMVRGQWQYREETEDEESQRIADRAI